MGQPGPWRSTINELDFTSALAGNLDTAEIETTRVSQCPNCAAQIEFATQDHAGECPFCATPVVADTGTHRHIKPKALLPFAIDERAARDAMTKWLGRLWFAPNGLQEYARKGRKMSGIYVPYWTYDADTKSSYVGERGQVYYETRTVTRDGKTTTEQVQRVRWFPAAGRVARFFDDVLVLASTSLPKRFTDALEPWDLAELVPYSPEYLAGFQAEGYSVDLEQDLSKHAKKWIALLRGMFVLISAATDNAFIPSTQPCAISRSNTSCCLSGWPLINIAVNPIASSLMRVQVRSKANAPILLGKLRLPR